MRFYPDDGTVYGGDDTIPPEEAEKAVALYRAVAVAMCDKPDGTDLTDDEALAAIQPVKDADMLTIGVALAACAALLDALKSELHDRTHH